MKRKDIFFLCLILAVYVGGGSVIAANYFQTNVSNVSEKEGKSEELRDVHLNEVETTNNEEVRNNENREEIKNNEEIRDSRETVSVNSNKAEPVGKEYFSDALFIGDSRTVGLKEYGGMEGAVFFADSGMSVFELWKKKIPVFSERKVSFEEVLYGKKYKKIYLMLGINELGYDFEYIQKKYQETLEKIREIQKDAIIYLCANMHITEEHSRQDEIYNNENVNRVNEMVCKLAQQENLYYIDVNELFDDENGCLSMEYSSDSFHVYGKYYMEWVDWLCTKAVTMHP